jgi:hypothetical protein
MREWQPAAQAKGGLQSQGNPSLARRAVIPLMLKQFDYLAGAGAGICVGAGAGGT